jgi:hypothetical protein
MFAAVWRDKANRRPLKKELRWLKKILRLLLTRCALPATRLLEEIDFLRKLGFDEAAPAPEKV